MIFAVVLVLIGLIMIYLEYFLPSSIFAIAGTLLILSSFIFLALEKIHFIYFILYVFVVVLSVLITMKIALKKLKSNKDFFLDSDQSGYRASVYEAELIGKMGVASSDLKPSGKIFVNDKYYSATCKEKYLVKGTNIQVIGGEGSCLIVKEII